MHEDDGHTWANEGAQPPHDREVELSVIAHMIIAPWRSAEFALSALASSLTEADFYSGSLGAIFGAIRAIAATGEPVEAVSIAAKLRETGKLQGAGGIGAIIEICNSANIVSAPVLQAHVRRLRDLSRLRHALLVVQKAQAEIYQAQIEDVADYGSKLLGDLNHVFLDGRGDSGRFQPIGVHAVEVVRRIGEARQRGAMAGISTGMREWDAKSSGLHDGDLTVVAGRPGMGKTSVMNAMAYACATAQRRLDEPPRVPALISIEMPGYQLAGRMACTVAGVEVTSLRSGRFVGSSYSLLLAELEKIRGLEVEILDAPALTLDEIVGHLRQLAGQLAARGRRLGTVIIDHLNIVRLVIRKGQNEVSAISDITRGLKALAKELACPIVLLAQLNREVEKRSDRRPMISDLRGSGSIEQDADNIVFLYRDDYYDRTSPDTGWLECIFAKQREGPTGMVRVGFDAKFVRLWDRDEEMEEGREAPEEFGFGDI